MCGEGKKGGVMDGWLVGDGGEGGVCVEVVDGEVLKVV